MSQTIADRELQSVLKVLRSIVQAKLSPETKVATVDRFVEYAGIAVKARRAER